MITCLNLTIGRMIKTVALTTTIYPCNVMREIWHQMSIKILATCTPKCTYSTTLIRINTTSLSESPRNNILAYRTFPVGMIQSEMVIIN